jgi:hypothetical protein
LLDEIDQVFGRGSSVVVVIVIVVSSRVDQVD